MADIPPDNPPIFSDAQKFDGTNWVCWSGRIKIAAEMYGVDNYLYGKTSRPLLNISATSSQMRTDPAQLPTQPTLTPWTSANPCPEEWKMRDAWTMGLLIFNIKNPIGLGVKMDGTSAQAWESLVNQ
ncbi:hypothetical protein BD779DRAFT_1435789, partial [Infundibulicybe gibba]